MNPIAITLILVILAAIVFIGQAGPQKVGAYMRRNGRRMGGASLLGLAGLMTVRGLWEPALIPAAIGWWLMTDAKMSGSFGSLLKVYLDRKFPGWRQHVNEDVGPRRKSGIGRPGVMTEEEAYEILGLQFGESREAIGAAYRAAMKKVHPDQGGAPEMAVRLNQARDLLLRRHG